MSHRSSCPSYWEARREGERAFENGYSRGANPYEDSYWNRDRACREAEDEWDRGYRWAEMREEERREEDAAHRRAEMRRQEMQAEEDAEYYAYLQEQYAAEDAREFAAIDAAMQADDDAAAAEAQSPAAGRVSSADEGREALPAPETQEARETKDQ